MTPKAPRLQQVMRTTLQRLRASCPPNLLSTLPAASEVQFEPHDWPGYIPYRLRIGTYNDPSDEDATNLPVWAYLSLKPSRIPNVPPKTILELGAYKDLGGDDELNWELYYENIRHHNDTDIGNELVELEGVFASEKSRGDLAALVKYYFLWAAEMKILRNESEGGIGGEGWDGKGVVWNDSWGQTMRAICRRVEKKGERKKSGNVGEKSRVKALTRSMDESSDDGVSSGELTDSSGSDTEDSDIEEHRSRIRSRSTKAKTRPSTKRQRKSQHETKRPTTNRKGITLSEYLALRERENERRAQKATIADSTPLSKYHLAECEPWSDESDNEQFQKPIPIGPKPKQKRQIEEVDSSSESDDTEDELPVETRWRGRSITRHAKRIATSRLQATRRNEVDLSDTDVSSVDERESSDRDSVVSSEEEEEAPRMRDKNATPTFNARKRGSLSEGPPTLTSSSATCQPDAFKPEAMSICEPMDLSERAATAIDSITIPFEQQVPVKKNSAIWLHGNRGPFSELWQAGTSIAFREPSYTKPMTHDSSSVNLQPPNSAISEGSSSSCESGSRDLDSRKAAFSKQMGHMEEALKVFRRMSQAAYSREPVCEVD